MSAARPSAREAEVKRATGSGHLGGDSLGVGGGKALGGQ